MTYRQSSGVLGVLQGWGYKVAIESSKNLVLTFPGHGYVSRPMHVLAVTQSENNPRNSVFRVELSTLDTDEHDIGSDVFIEGVMDSHGIPDGYYTLVNVQQPVGESYALLTVGLGFTIDAGTTNPSIARIYVEDLFKFSYDEPPAYVTGKNARARWFPIMQPEQGAVSIGSSFDYLGGIASTNGISLSFVNTEAKEIGDVLKLVASNLLSRDELLSRGGRPLAANVHRNITHLRRPYLKNTDALAGFKARNDDIKEISRATVYSTRNFIELETRFEGLPLGDAGEDTAFDFYTQFIDWSYIAYGFDNSGTDVYARRPVWIGKEAMQLLSTERLPPNKEEEGLENGSIRISVRRGILGTRRQTHPGSRSSAIIKDCPNMQGHRAVVWEMGYADRFVIQRRIILDGLVTGIYGDDASQSFTIEISDWLAASVSDKNDDNIASSQLDWLDHKNDSKEGAQHPETPPLTWQTSVDAQGDWVFDLAGMVRANVAYPWVEDCMSNPDMPVRTAWNFLKVDKVALRLRGNPWYLRGAGAQGSGAASWLDSSLVDWKQVNSRNQENWDDSATTLTKFWNPTVDGVARNGLRLHNLFSVVENDFMIPGGDTSRVSAERYSMILPVDRVVKGDKIYLQALPEMRASHVSQGGHADNGYVVDALEGLDELRRFSIRRGDDMEMFDYGSTEAFKGYKIEDEEDSNSFFERVAVSDLSRIERALPLYWNGDWVIDNRVGRLFRWMRGSTVPLSRIATAATRRRTNEKEIQFCHVFEKTIDPIVQDFTNDHLWESGDRLAHDLEDRDDDLYGTQWFAGDVTRTDSPVSAIMLGDVLLQLLTSTEGVIGKSSNGKYDVLPPRVGLGIPQHLFNKESFLVYTQPVLTNVCFTEKDLGKTPDFIKEICESYGIILTIRAGRITMISSESIALHSILERSVMSRVLEGGESAAVIDDILDTFPPLTDHDLVTDGSGAPDFLQHEYVLNNQLESITYDVVNHGVTWQQPTEGMPAYLNTITTVLAPQKALLPNKGFKGSEIKRKPKHMSTLHDIATISESTLYISSRPLLKLTLDLYDPEDTIGYDPEDTELFFEKEFRDNTLIAEYGTLSESPTSRVALYSFLTRVKLSDLKLGPFSEPLDAMCLLVGKEHDVFSGISRCTFYVLTNVSELVAAIESNNRWAPSFIVDSVSIGDEPDTYKVTRDVTDNNAQPRKRFYPWQLIDPDDSESPKNYTSCIVLNPDFTVKNPVASDVLEVTEPGGVPTLIVYAPTWSGLPTVKGDILTLGVKEHQPEGTQLLYAFIDDPDSFYRD